MNWQPTNELRWRSIYMPDGMGMRIFLRRVLQQKWIDDNGIYEWRDVQEVEE